MFTVDRMTLQAEMDYRGQKLRRGVRAKRANRFAEPHQHRTVLAPEDVKRAR